MRGRGLKRRVTGCRTQKDLRFRSWISTFSLGLSCTGTLLMNCWGFYCPRIYYTNYKDQLCFFFNHTDKFRSLKTPFLPLATLSPGCVVLWLQVWRREHGGGRRPELVQRCLGSYVCWNQFDVGSEARGHGATAGRWVIQIKGDRLLSHSLPPGLRLQRNLPSNH